MKNQFLSRFAFALLCLAALAATPMYASEPTTIPDSIAARLDQPIREVLHNLQWTGQASLRLVVGDKIVFIDPFNLTGTDSADVVLITHSHGDHLSVADLKKVVTSQTKIVAPAGCGQALAENGFVVHRTVAPGDSFVVDGVAVKAVPSYTITKPTHPKADNWVGYLIDVDGVMVYHPGDTQRIPEMKDIRCHIAFMPLGQKYTMDTVDDAVQAILDIRPKLAIPFHYGMYEGNADDAVYFQKSLRDKGVEVIILK